MAYLLSHDIGTSANKAALFSIDGSCIESVSCSYNVDWLPNGGAEQNPEAWYEAVLNSTKILLKKIDASKVLSISFSAQMQCCLCVDKNGRPLMNAMIWADSRSTKEEQELYENFDTKEFFQTTGCRPSCTFTLPKLMWIKQHYPHIYKETYKVLNVKDYILFRLTGNFVTDYSDASATNIFDINRLEWSSFIADALDISLDKFPEIKRSTDVVGYISKHIAGLSSLKQGTPVVCGGGDGCMAAVGACCIQPGTAYCTIGTSSWNACTSETPILRDDMKTFNLVHVVPDYYMPLGTMQTAGVAISWIKDQLLKNSEDFTDTNDVFDNINNLVEKSNIGADGLVFLPYLLGERSPWWNPNARAAFIGLTINSTHSQMFRAVFEGIIMNLEIIFTLINENKSIDSIVLTGGVAKSQVFAQILADVYQVQVKIPRYLDEATSIGAAVTAGVGIGQFEFDAIHKFNVVENNIEQIEKHVEVYTHLKEIFVASYHQLEDIYSRIADFTAMYS